MSLSRVSEDCGPTLNDSIFGPPDEPDADQRQPAPQSTLASPAYLASVPENPDIELSLFTLEEEQLQHPAPSTTSVHTTTKTKPIAISTEPTLAEILSRDLDRAPSIVPLSGRGERPGHYFPFTRSLSPHFRASCPAGSPFRYSSRRRRRSSSSNSSSRSDLMFAMHDRYVPTSPLSPQHPRQTSTAQQSKRNTHARQTSRNMQRSMSLPRFHPLAYPHHGSAATPSSATLSPAIAVNGQLRQANSPSPIPRKHREFLDISATTTTQTSAVNGEPGSPRLEPLHSPRGPVTPLALEIEEPVDYFAVKRAGKPSPAGSPGAASSRSDASSGGEGTSKKVRKVDAYQ